MALGRVALAAVAFVRGALADICDFHYDCKEHNDSWCKDARPGLPPDLPQKVITQSGNCATGLSGYTCQGDSDCHTGEAPFCVAGNCWAFGCCYNVDSDDSDEDTLAWQAVAIVVGGGALVIIVVGCLCCRCGFCGKADSGCGSVLKEALRHQSEACGGFRTLRELEVSAEGVLVAVVCPVRCLHGTKPVAVNIVFLVLSLGAALSGVLFAVPEGLIVPALLGGLCRGVVVGLLVAQMSRPPWRVTWIHNIGAILCNIGGLVALFATLMSKEHDGPDGARNVPVDVIVWAVGFVANPPMLLKLSVKSSPATGILRLSYRAIFTSTKDTRSGTVVYRERTVHVHETIYELPIAEFMAPDILS